MSPLVLALAIGLGADAVDRNAKAPAHRSPAPPKRVAVPKQDEDHPLLSNPQLSLDGKRVFIAATRLPASGLSLGLDVRAIPLAPGPKAETVHFPIQVSGNQVRVLLSRNDKYLAVLSQGELWIKTLGEAAEARRLYPPAIGDAPLGPSLSQAAFATDSTWLLVESPKGWGRLSVTGDFGGLSLPAIDLTTGSLDMSPDGSHAGLAKPQRGEGFLNGSPVLALNIQTGFTQGLDIEHLYTEVLFLPDGHLLGKEGDGELWLLRPKSRLAYFKPPAVHRGTSVDGYAINFAATRLAWVLTSGLQGRIPKAELWVAGAPPTPEPPKEQKRGED